ncbi:hypothetical protein ACU686_36625 [Yinghuangia aomiensis]
MTTDAKGAFSSAFTAKGSYGTTDCTKVACGVVVYDIVHAHPPRAPEGRSPRPWRRASLPRASRHQARDREARHEQAVHQRPAAGGGTSGGTSGGASAAWPRRARSWPRPAAPT